MKNKRIDMDKTRASLSAKPPARRKILIVDDHPMMREGLRAGINREPDLMVCGEAENAQQAMDAVQKLAPDLALVDVNLPGKNGLELVKDFRAVHPQMAILAISMHDESLYAERMLRAGAGGYLTKQQPPEELIKAIRLVLDKQIYVSKELSETLLGRLSGQKPAKHNLTEILSDREFQIYQMIGQGLAPKEIARQLYLSIKTVAVHNANIRKKLGFRTTAQLIRLAAQSEGLKFSENE
jgi:DNA-binding NarL/FixJ family response regulator